MPEYETEPDTYDHDVLTYNGTGAAGAPAKIYEEWCCDECSAIMAEVYNHVRHRIIRRLNGDAYDNGGRRDVAE